MPGSLGVMGVPPAGWARGGEGELWRDEVAHNMSMSVKLGACILGMLAVPVLSACSEEPAPERTWSPSTAEATWADNELKGLPVPAVAGKDMFQVSTDRDLVRAFIQRSLRVLPSDTALTRTQCRTAVTILEGEVSAEALFLTAVRMTDPELQLLTWEARKEVGTFLSTCIRANGASRRQTTAARQSVLLVNARMNQSTPS